MITLFRVNSFIHVFTILAVLLLLKVPYMLGGLPVLQPELEWMLLAEKLNEGKSIYSEIWTSTGPLSAIVYSVIHLLFGRSQLYFELVALVIVYFQALYFTLICNNGRLTLEKNYLPALFYVLVMSLTFDLSKTTPALLALSFLLLALNSLFKQIENKDEGSEYVFEIGLYLGVGSLFWFQMPIFTVWAILSLLMFTSLKIKQFFLFVLGFSLPELVIMLYFYFKGNFSGYYDQWLLKGLNNHPFVNVDFKMLALVFGLPIVFAILGLLRVIAGSRYNNFQNRKHQVIMLSGMFGFLAYFFGTDGAAYQMIGIVPFLVFFIMGLFIHLKGAYIPELLFVVFVVIIVSISSASVNNFFGNGFNYLSEMIVKEDEDVSELVREKRILVTGPSNDAYLHAKSSTKYLNWNLAEAELTTADTYEGITAVYESLRSELPEIIIDNATVFPAIFERIPTLNACYEKVSGTSHYRLTKAGMRLP